MVEIAVAIAAFVVAILLGGIYIRLNEKKADDTGGSEQSLLLLQNQINEITRTLDRKLGESSMTIQNALQSQFGESRRIIQDVTERLTKLDETNKQVVGFADQLKNLQDILKNPKQRGILGEYYLETVLKNVLPPGSYQMQYKFSNGDIVDGAVFVGKNIIPVDSKFPLENYNRILETHNETDKKKFEAAFVADIKNRIDETAKYVKPQEGTMEFAFMFIPSEAVFYDLLINKIGAVTDETRNLITYAWGKKVIVVSPTSFLAYLQTVLQGMNNLRISETAKEIIGQVGNLRRHLASYEDNMQKLGRNLGTTVNMYNSAYKEFGKIDKDILKITGEKNGTEPLLIERPSEEI